LKVIEESYLVVILSAVDGRTQAWNNVDDDDGLKVDLEMARDGLLSSKMNEY